ncbi:hypothetical protein QNN85_26855 [Agrobacterium rhizogenes]|nr:hypothetical protein [Rhizobium rhizogenes]
MIRGLAVIVGNGSIERDLSSVVDNGDFVMRFKAKLACYAG